MTAVRVSSGRMMRGIYLWSSFGFLLLCCAQDVPCTVTQDAGQTHYRVSDFIATNCHYWWTNSTNHTLANHDSKSKMVVMKNIRTLLIEGCSEQINYLRDCISEGEPREANCITTCSGHVPQSGGGISLRPSGISYHWVAVTVAVVIILLVGLVTYLCCMYRCRKKDYAGVKNVAEEEVERM